MVNKGAIVVITSAASIATLSIIASIAKGAARLDLDIVEAADILNAETVGQLQIYYNYISELYYTQRISRDTYNSLYEAYVLRFYQLTGAN